ncbi:hypothetical protein GCM10009679_17090 [Saccharothrix algeriensis]
MYHAAAVRHLQHRRDAHADAHRLAPGQRAQRDAVGQRLAGDELEHDEGDLAAVGRAGAHEVVHTRHVGVVEPGHRPRLAPGQLAQPLVAGQAWVQHLQRDQPVQRLVPGPPDDRHTPGADPVDQAIPLDQKVAGAQRVAVVGHERHVAA